MLAFFSPVPGTPELSGRAGPRLAGVSVALCLPAALILQTPRTEGGGPCALDKLATGKPVRMFSIKFGHGGEDSRRISLQKLICFQRLSAARCKSDAKSPFKKKERREKDPKTIQFVWFEFVGFVFVFPNELWSHGEK